MLEMLKLLLREYIVSSVCPQMLQYAKVKSNTHLLLFQSIVKTTFVAAPVHMYACESTGALLCDIRKMCVMYAYFRVQFLWLLLLCVCDRIN